MFSSGVSTYSIESILLWILTMCLGTWVCRWTASKTHPVQADPSFQNPGRESAEDFYY